MAGLACEQVEHEQLEVTGGKYTGAAFAAPGAPFEGVMGGKFTHGNRGSFFAIYRKILLKIYLKTSPQLLMILI
jgi:hypothetical protein